jgi:multidrug efflux system outer membrane protein
MRSRLGVLALASALSACVVGPKYNPPVMPVPPAFERLTPGLDPAEPVARFWTRFDDALLNRLMERALTDNHDVRLAVARLHEARALRKETRFDRWPTVEAGGGYTKSKLSADQSPGSSASERRSALYDAGFDATWELDLFGRVRRAVEARSAAAQAAEFDVRAVQVSVAGELAATYFELRGLQGQLAVLRRNLENQRATLDMTRARLDAGRGTEFDAERARAQVELTAAGIPLLEASASAAAHRLAVLTGQMPGALLAELQPASELPAWPDVTAIGSPETLLRRRPDVQAAERRLASQTALVGVAVADLFPRVAFSASLGRSASDVGDLDDNAASTYRFGPSITWPALNLGRVKARVRASRARTDQALAFYEQTVLRAIEETENALVTSQRARERAEHLAQAAQASERAAELARLRFEGGVSDFLQVLDAERTLLEAQDRTAASRTAATTALVAVYKALAGGWASAEAGSAAPAATSTSAGDRP